MSVSASFSDLPINIIVNQLEKQDNLCLNLTIRKLYECFSMNDLKKKPINNFTVAVRIRPSFDASQSQINAINQLSMKNNNNESEIEYKVPNKQTLMVSLPQQQQPYTYSYMKNRKYQFNRIFANESNKQIFRELIQPKLSILKQNLNLTILTYGVTGSGKTHTVFGKRVNEKITKEDGLALLAFDKIFQENRSNKVLGKNACKFSFSYMQIYNENVHDLLAQQTDPNKLKSLSVLQDNSGHLNIADLKKIPIQSSEQIRNLIDQGNLLRACSSNFINKLSSRSHAILQLTCCNITTRVQNTLTVIDLAGSQKLLAYNNQTTLKNIQKEGSNINRSLLALGNCINSLENGNSHIPYRDSKLTRILKDDLSGKGINIMVACIGRDLCQSQQTINTLQYASRAAKIEVQLSKQQDCYQKGFICEDCGNIMEWKYLIPKIPQKYNKKQRQSLSNTNKRPSFGKTNNLLQTNMGFYNLMRQFRNQIIQLVKSQLQLKLSSQEMYSITSRSNSVYLFNEKSQIQGHLPQDNTMINSLLKNLTYGIQQMFDFYQSQLKKKMQQYSNNLEGVTAMTTKIDQLFNKSNEQQNKTCLTLTGNNKKQKRSATATNKTRAWTPLTSNQSQDISYGYNISMGQDAYRKLSPLTDISYPNLEFEKQQLLCEQYRKSSNLRKNRKISLTYKNKNMENTQKGLISQNTTFDGSENYLINLKSNRMNPDIDSDDEMPSNKEAILKKIINARQRNSQSNNVEVSSFDIGI